MKGEDIYNGVTEIRDDLIEGAAAPQRRRPAKSAKAFAGRFVFFSAQMAWQIIAIPQEGCARR